MFAPMPTLPTAPLYTDTSAGVQSIDVRQRETRTRGEDSD